MEGALLEKDLSFAPRGGRLGLGKYGCMPYNAIAIQCHSVLCHKSSRHIIYVYFTMHQYSMILNLDPLINARPNHTICTLVYHVNICTLLLYVLIRTYMYFTLPREHTEFRHTI